MLHSYLCALAPDIFGEVELLLQSVTLPYTLIGIRHSVQKVDLIHNTFIINVFKHPMSVRTASSMELMTETHVHQYLHQKHLCYTLHIKVQYWGKDLYRWS